MFAIKNINWCVPDYITSGFHQDSDLLDRRKHCFSVQSESGEDLYFSVELESDLTLWEKAFQTATFLEVERIQVRKTALVNIFWYINELSPYEILMQFKKILWPSAALKLLLFNVSNCFWCTQTACNLMFRRDHLKYNLWVIRTWYVFVNWSSWTDEKKQSVDQGQNPAV